MFEEVTENVFRTEIMVDYMSRLLLEEPGNSSLKTQYTSMKFELEGNKKLKKYLEEYKVKPELKA